MFNTILVAFKFSQGGMLALETGARLAREQHADLYVFHALDYRLQRLEPTDPALVENKALFEQRFQAEALPCVNDACSMDFHCIPDDPAMGICTAAIKLKADLIILGEHQKTGSVSLGRLDYIGMTVMEKAPCPVMIVPFR
jgi:nucleotide-binding universal stress UspA family protein